MAKFDPFLSLDYAPTPSSPAQSKEWMGSNFAIWQPWRQDEELQLVGQGPQEVDHRHRQDEAPLQGPQEVQERLQGGHGRRLAEK